MRRISYYRRSLIIPYALVAAAGIVVASSHILAMPQWFDFPLELSALILMGGAVALPLYSIVAVILLRRSRAVSMDESTALGWAFVTPVAVALLIIGLLAVKGFLIGRPFDGVAVGVAIAGFVLVVGYVIVGAIAGGARG